MFLAEIDKSQIASLSNIGTTETIFQLTGGGAAVLSVPSDPFVDGQAFKLILAGQTHNASGTPSFALYVGNSTTVANNQLVVNIAGNATDSVGQSGIFVIEETLFWDSVSQLLVARSPNIGSGSFSAATGITSQSQLQFVVSLTFSASNASNSGTITEYKLELI